MRRQQQKLVLAALAAGGTILSIVFETAPFAALFGALFGVWIGAWLRIWAESHGYVRDRSDP